MMSAIPSSSKCWLVRLQKFAVQKKHQDDEGSMSLSPVPITAKKILKCSRKGCTAVLYETEREPYIVNCVFLRYCRNCDRHTCSAHERWCAKCQCFDCPNHAMEPEPEPNPKSQPKPKCWVCLKPLNPYTPQSHPEEQ